MHATPRFVGCVLWMFLLMLPRDAWAQGDVTGQIRSFQATRSAARILMDGGSGACPFTCLCRPFLSGTTQHPESNPRLAPPYRARAGMGASGRARLAGQAAGRFATLEREGMR
jgi:hypothetical protein